MSNIMVIVKPCQEIVLILMIETWTAKIFNNAPRQPYFTRFFIVVMNILTFQARYF